MSLIRTSSAVVTVLAALLAGCATNQSAPTPDAAAAAATAPAANAAPVAGLLHPGLQHLQRLEHPDRHHHVHRRRCPWHYRQRYSHCYRYGWAQAGAIVVPQGLFPFLAQIPVLH